MIEGGEGEAKMDEPTDKQPGSNEKLSGLIGDNLGIEVPAGESGNHEINDKKPLKEELVRLKELIVELKGNLIVLNGGIVARQDMIDQLTKRKQELLEADKDKDQTTSAGLATAAIRKTNSQNLMDNPLARDAIQVFPEEIWEMILGNLTEPQDLRNCIASCQLFDKILHPLKQNFLFLGVFPYLCTFLDNALILSCRRVCKGWNEGVDSFAENHPALVPCDKAVRNHRYPPPTTNGRFLFEYSNRRGGLRQLKFLEKMRDHPRNPFVGRAVRIRICSDNLELFDNGSSDSENDHGGGVDFARGLVVFLASLREKKAFRDSLDQLRQLFWQSLVTFLRVFGKHIWYLSFECDRNGSFLNETSLFRFLTEEIFILAPNLRRIQINGYVPRPYLMAMEGPLPVVPNLKTLEIVREREPFGPKYITKGSVIGTLIHASYQQLKQLHVHYAAWNYIFKSNLELTNLTELYISNDGVDEILKAEDLVPSRMPQLKKIVLKIDKLKCDFQTIIKIINKLSAETKLHVFRLFGGIERKQILQTPDSLFAHPNLKTLEMDRIILQGDYSFLLRFPFLENLVIICDKKNGVTKGEGFLEREVVELETHMLQGRVYECEIWKLLPRLKVFTVGRDVHTRECYERIMSRKKKNLKSEGK